MTRLRSIAVWAWALAVASSALAQQDDWPLDRIWVRGGQEHRGLLLDQSERQVEFADIVRPRGKPMYAIVRALDAREVTGRLLTEGAERKQLIERFNQFRNCALIEAGRMESIALFSLERDGVEYTVYEGPWFTLLSTAEETITRRSIVRIEQSFRAYRQVLPAQGAKHSTLQIYLFGSSAEYRDAARRWGVEAEHPAFFAAERNTIAAGSDLDRFSDEVAKAHQENERTRQQLRNLRASHERTLLEVSSDMKKAGFTGDEIEAEIRARRSAWKVQQEKLEQEIESAHKANAAKFDALAAGMFRRLNHEAFHAYLENFAYDSDTHRVPRWLNEGLAQVFEHAQLDADTLRIDAPAADLLARLQADLKRPDPLPLDDLLTREQSFTAMHSRQAAAERRYLYAWGLAHYLTFDRAGLNTPKFAEYIAASGPTDKPIARFERWVGRPLPEFETQWRSAMLGITAGGKR